MILWPTNRPDKDPSQAYVSAYTAKTTACGQPIERMCRYYCLGLLWPKMHEIDRNKTGTLVFGFPTYRRREKWGPCVRYSLRETLIQRWEFLGHASEVLFRSYSGRKKHPTLGADGGLPHRQQVNLFLRSSLVNREKTFSLALSKSRG